MSDETTEQDMPLESLAASPAVPAAEVRTVPAGETGSPKLKGALEALLFITDRPLKLEELQEFAAAGPDDVRAVLDDLRAEYEARGGVQILHVAEGFQMGTRPEHGEPIRRLYKERMTFRLSQAALETLSIIAYRQPLTRAEIEEIRGVEVIAALETLLEKRLAKVVGRKEAIGRPLLYGTTAEFLRQFGLASLEDLPSLDTFQAAEAAAAPAAQPSLEAPAEPAADPPETSADLGPAPSEPLSDPADFEDGPETGGEPSEERPR